MGRIFLRGTILSLFLLSIVPLNWGEQPPAPHDSTLPHAARTHGVKRRIKGIGNFGEVTPTLFRGGQPSEAGFQALAKKGIDIVVDNRGDRTKTEGKEVKRLGMQYIAIPWHCPFPHDEAFAKFLQLVRENPGKKIFVHCRLGDDRTGMMIAAYRIADQGWTADEAMSEMQHFGFSRAHHFICPTLASYERTFPKHLKSNPAFR
jgi:protein tyrosine phosphatase (PTP) superfamily phosphohydrolase (DUF442 family)